MIMEKLISFLKSLPKWPRIVAVLFLAVLAGLYFFFSVSCSSVKAISYGSGRVDTTVRQAMADSTTVSVSVNRR